LSGESSQAQLTHLGLHSRRTDRLVPIRVALPGGRSRKAASKPSFPASFPVTAHLLASRLKQITGKPWIADFRDLWTENHYADYSSRRA
jgi:hypothetical protein